MDNQLKRLRLARKEFELALNEFVGMEIEVRVVPSDFQRNDHLGPWKVSARVIVDAEALPFGDDF